MADTRLPATLVSGDSLVVSVGLPTSPATREVRLVGPVNLTLTGLPDGTAKLTGTQSDTLIPGIYSWTVLELDAVADTRKTLSYGQTRVTPDLTEVTAGTDQRSWAAQALSAVEAQLLAKGDATAFALFNRSFSFSTHADLIAYRAFLKREVDAESARARGVSNAFIAFDFRRR
jgi:hypothetical protein